MTFVFILALLFSQAPATKSASRQWHAANFQGLIVGRSKRAEMLRRFGQPKWSQTKPDDKDEDKNKGKEKEPPRLTWNHYEKISDLPGMTNIAVDSRTGIVTRIDFFPDRLTRAQAIAHFGTDYIVIRYAFDECERDEDVEAIYESPNGPLISVEYRGRGIAITVGANDMVTRIRYVSRPIGSTRSRCNP